MEDAVITAIATAGSQLAVLAAKGTATFKHLTAPVYIEIGLRCSASGTISKVNY